MQINHNSLKNNNGAVLLFHRCLDKNKIYFSPNGNGTDYCSEMLPHHQVPNSIPVCCDDRDFCNENLTVVLKPG